MIKKQSQTSYSNIQQFITCQKPVTGFGIIGSRQAGVKDTQ